MSFSPTQIEAVRAYIKATWKTLSRNHVHIVDAARDPKLDHVEGKPWPIYISGKEDPATVRRTVQQAISPEEYSQIEIRVLPAEMDLIDEHGLLYLPHEYVVPGGRFNEMYGWDSYFIQLGLLRDGEMHLARSLVDQLVYEIEHYGTILNANRSYLLTRSQPPFFTQMILNLFHHTQDREWLRGLLPSIENHYFYWTVPPHRNQTTGLSRYFAYGEGPAPEVISSEQDEAGRTHYDRVCDYYRQFRVDDYDVDLYYDRENDCLTELFYRGDRTMRESGLDPTNRFGPFSADIIHYAPVCLNVLLYQMEQDMARINEILGYTSAARYWRGHAEGRHKAIDKFLWDEAAGLYFDYNFHTGQRRPYEYITTFYPLWAGLASPHQAARVVQNLPKFEAPGGLLTSTHVSGNQWDAPFGWAPMHLLAIQGLSRYGYEEDAHRITQKFLNLVFQEFEKTGTLVEKYDVENCSANVSAEIFFGYSSNEIGFGWTNGVVLELLAMLEQSS